MIAEVIVQINAARFLDGLERTDEAYAPGWGVKAVINATFALLNSLPENAVLGEIDTYGCAEC
ncbi:MAG: hypothetical protein O3C21_10470 [Verrucomicrobia bacterium]|nr:hypothetical protein [Verrucomicrobiota bacterium]